MNHAAYLKAMRTGISDELIGAAQRWECVDCASTDVTLEWSRDRRGPFVQITHFHTEGCPDLRHREATPTGMR